MVLKSTAISAKEAQRTRGNSASFAPSLRLFFFFLLLLSFSCRENAKQTNSTNEDIKYATGFSYEKKDDYTLLTVYNPWRKGTILQEYVLVPKSRELPVDLPKGTLIRTPLENVVCFSSVICGFLEELGVSGTITGVAESEYIKIPAIQERVGQGKILDVGQGPNPDVEKLFMLNPEVIFANTMQDVGIGQVGKTGIPIVECMEYMETLPLGQTEWICFLAFFFDKEEEANKLFEATEQDYNQLKDQVGSLTNRPTVFTETMYSGVWYIPGGNSYIAHLLEDAGADYLWKGDSGSGAINCSFEQVLEKAETADYWLVKGYSPNPMSYSELLSKNANYALFDAYKNRNVYLCNTYEALYYEDLPIHPDRILANLIAIFHPELGIKPEVLYYVPMR